MIGKAVAADPHLNATVTGFGPLNEPFAYTTPSVLKGYYDDALAIVRDVLGERVTVYIGDMFNSTVFSSYWRAPEDGLEVGIALDLSIATAPLLLPCALRLRGRRGYRAPPRCCPALTAPAWCRRGRAAVSPRLAPAHGPRSTLTPHRVCGRDARAPPCAGGRGRRGPTLHPPPAHPPGRLVSQVEATNVVLDSHIYHCFFPNYRW